DRCPTPIVEIQDILQGPSHRGLTHDPFGALCRVLSPRRWSLSCRRARRAASTCRDKSQGRGCESEGRPKPSDLSPPATCQLEQRPKRPDLLQGVFSPVLPAQSLWRCMGPYALGPFLQQGSRPLGASAHCLVAIAKPRRGAYLFRLRCPHQE